MFLFHNQFNGTEWPIMRWCAVKKLLTHSLTHPRQMSVFQLASALEGGTRRDGTWSRPVAGSHWLGLLHGEQAPPYLSSLWQCGRVGAVCGPHTGLTTRRLGLCVPAKCLAATTIPVHAVMSTYGCLLPNQHTSSSVNCNRVILSSWCLSFRQSSSAQLHSWVSDTDQHRACRYDVDNTNEPLCTCTCNMEKIFNIISRL